MSKVGPGRDLSCDSYSRERISFMTHHNLIHLKELGLTLLADGRRERWRDGGREGVGGEEEREGY